MRLVLHIGLHKTASTAVQTLCRDNAGLLAEAGVHWRVHQGYPAHHETAWALLRGETGAIDDYIAEARTMGARTALLSSEELDYVLHVPQKAQAIEAAARAAGVTEIVWIAALRRPSEVFRSLISELTKHGIHLDPLQGYLEIRRTGGLHFTGRLNGGAQFWNWFYTFDYPRYVGRLREAVAGRVVAYDYHAPERFPGAAVLREATHDAGMLMDRMTPPGLVNARLSEAEIALNLGAMLAGYGHEPEEVAALLAARATCERAAAETGAARIIDDALDVRFGDYAAVLGDGMPVMEEA
ncbi:hypothetical protein N8I71_09665 [Roseibacterium sp. SDUM158016]|uniref:hypothetical protein n=1 Tax=Roseicyclus sediminis TaxID=2980997 RepID=UPI0021D17560|nr:hypothetical protein [Roseibacterium sp. SDUM158016]MCU4653099.1 hypothetical protein [Roseibacterium sp. SDUM158016]